jgi:hypothetical protein
MTNWTGKGGFRERPENARRYTKADAVELARRGRNGGALSGEVRGKLAEARALAVARQAALTVRADLAEADLARLAQVFREVYRLGDRRGYARRRQQDERAAARAGAA